MSDLRTWLLRDDLPGGRACDVALEWLAITPEASVEACPQGEWLLWLAVRLGYERAALAAAVRPAVLRALRVYAPDALDAAGLTEHSRHLRSLREECDLEAAAQSAWRAADVAYAAGAADATDAADAAANAAMRAADVAYAAHAAYAAMRAAAHVADAAYAAQAAARAAYAAGVAAVDDAAVVAFEHARCADDVRDALPDLADRLREAWMDEPAGEEVG